MGPIWGRQNPGGPHVGPMNFAIWVCTVDTNLLLVEPGIALFCTFLTFFLHKTARLESAKQIIAARFNKKAYGLSS